jgi:hypothetical protein
MRGLVARYAHLKHSSPTQRLLFRKILKGYDQKDVALTMSSRKKQLLEALDKSLLILDGLDRVLEEALLQGPKLGWVQSRHISV